VEGVIVSPVLKFLLEVAADLEMQVRSHGHIPSIEQAMDVAPEK
jgi:hypothetical protein